MQKHTMSQELFDKLVNNAIDFLHHSLSDIENNPKYSLIHFYAAIELFLKARLLWEHWALVDEMPHKATFGGFKSGESKSVGIEEAIRRLEKIAEVHFTAQEKDCFSTLRKHRNQLMHFSHPLLRTPANKSVRETIVSEQFRAWFYLHRMLTQRWKDQFVEYQAQIEALHSSIKGRKRLLQAKFEDLAPDIEKGKERGEIFVKCLICEFEACVASKTALDKLYQGKCLVCEPSSVPLLIECPNCSAINELGQSSCTSCGFQLRVEALLEIVAPSQSLKDRMNSPGVAYCSECKFTDAPTVIPFLKEPKSIPWERHVWLCLNCSQLWEQHNVGTCGWCGEFVTGETGDYHSPGCFMCAWHIEFDSNSDFD